nr:hypothetical protein FVER53263_20054 [Fusarium verticillioides]
MLGVNHSNSRSLSNSESRQSPNHNLSNARLKNPSPPSLSGHLFLSPQNGLQRWRSCSRHLADMYTGRSQRRPQLR